jgi:hypothetical protein
LSNPVFLVGGGSAGILIVTFSALFVAAKLRAKPHPSDDAPAIAKEEKSFEKTPVISLVDQAVTRAEHAFQDVQTREKAAGDNFEHIINSYRAFLVKHPTASPKVRDTARKKIEEELPAKMDDRDYEKALKHAEGIAFHPVKARPPFEKYQADHPKGRHAPRSRTSPGRGPSGQG